MVKAMETVPLNAEARADVGSRAMRRLRQAGWLPAVVYSAGAPASSIRVNRHALEMLVRRHGGQNLIIDLAVDGAPPKKVLLKDVQRDRLRDEPLHADFLEISMTRKLRVPVAIRLTGEPVGVTQQGGVLEHLVRTIEVECLPGDMVGEFPLDVSGLAIGDHLFVRDLKIDARFTVLTPGDITVASVQMPKEEEEVKPEEGAEAAAAEPEVIGEKKEGEAAAEAEGGDAKKDKAKDAKETKDGKEAKDAKDAKDKGGKDKGAAKDKGGKEKGK